MWDSQIHPDNSVVAILPDGLLLLPLLLLQLMCSPTLLAPSVAQPLKREAPLIQTFDVPVERVPL
jgi:hypothetical protein